MCLRIDILIPGCRVVTISSPVSPLLKSGRNTYFFHILKVIVSSISLSVILFFQICSLRKKIFYNALHRRILSKEFAFNRKFLKIQHAYKILTQIQMVLFARNAVLLHFLLHLCSKYRICRFLPLTEMVNSHKAFVQNNPSSNLDSVCKIFERIFKLRFQRIQKKKRFLVIKQKKYFAGLSSKNKKRKYLLFL